MCPFLSVLVHWFLRCRCSLLPSPVDHIQFTLIYGPKLPDFCAILIFTVSDFTFTHQTHSQLSITSNLAQPLHSYEAISKHPLLLPSSILDTLWPGCGAHLLGSYLFDFSYCPWVTPGKNTRVGCHFLLQGIFPTQGSNSSSFCFSELFTMTHPSLVVLHGMAHSFNELCKVLHHDRAVIHDYLNYTDAICLPILIQARVSSCISCNICDFFYCIFTLKSGLKCTFETI